MIIYYFFINCKITKITGEIVNYSIKQIDIQFFSNEISLFDNNLIYYVKWTDILRIS